jgi:flagellin-like protein
MTFKDNNEGVSAILGVILIVLITIVLAGVVAEFGFQLGDQIPKPHNVGTRIERTSQDVISVKTISGDLLFLKSGSTDHHNRAEATYMCTVNGAIVNPVNAVGVELLDGMSDFDTSMTGDLMYFPVNQNDDIIVVAQFTDDTSVYIFSGKIP